jgi:hypothetical protein
MKNWLLLSLLISPCVETAEGQRTSLSSFLDQRVSLEVSALSITDAVRQLVAAAKQENPEVVNGIGFIYEDSQKFPLYEGFNLVLKGETVRRVFDQIGAAYRHTIIYDYSEGRVRLVAASGGSDPTRKFIFTTDVASRLGLSFTSEKEVHERFVALGVLANIENIDLAKRTVIARGRQIYLDEFDMIVTVYGLLKIPDKE